MIDIKRKEDCVGCEGCVQRCPTHCIEFLADEQGFSYPTVDIDKCIDCHLCEKVCPVINRSESIKPLRIIAAKNNDTKQIHESSSGGIFILLAAKIISQGGVVFGARFDDDWGVKHDYAETIEDVRHFQGSKYLQSRIGTTFRDVEKFLKQGRKVMFTGTPCQLSALQLYLRKDYGDQLLKVDVICHGVPSPLIWRNYIHDISHKQNLGITDNRPPLKISTISFRDKTVSWQKYGLRISFNPADSIVSDKMCHHVEYFNTLDTDLYIKGFLSDTFLRPSCYECPVRDFKSGSDITLGDFWGIHKYHPDFADSTGVSLVIGNTPLGTAYLDEADCKVCNSTLQTAISSNPALVKNPVRNRNYEWFWLTYAENPMHTLNQLYKRLKPSLKIRIKRRLKRLLKR